MKLYVHATLKIEGFGAVDLPEVKEEKRLGDQKKSMGVGVRDGRTMSLTSSNSSSNIRDGILFREESDLRGSV